MSFNPEVTEQAQEVVFSRKSQKVTNSTVYFPVTRSSSQKHLGIYLDEKLNFIHHIKEKNSKASKGVSVINKMNNTLPRKALLTLYKSFVRPHLDYGDIIYDQPNNESFCNKKKKTLWPLFMDGVQLPQGLSHFEEAVYFLPLSSQKFLVLILSTSGG